MVLQPIKQSATDYGPPRRVHRGTSTTTSERFYPLQAFEAACNNNNSKQQQQQQHRRSSASSVFHLPRTSDNATPPSSNVVARMRRHLKAFRSNVTERVAPTRSSNRTATLMPADILTVAPRQSTNNSRHRALSDDVFVESKWSPRPTTCEQPPISSSNTSSPTSTAKSTQAPLTSVSKGSRADSGIVEAASDWQSDEEQQQQSGGQKRLEAAAAATSSRQFDAASPAASSSSIRHPAFSAVSSEGSERSGNNKRCSAAVRLADVCSQQSEVSSVRRFDVWEEGDASSDEEGIWLYVF